MKSKIPREVLPTIVERLNSGEPYQSIADSVGVSKERIRQIRKELRLHYSGTFIRRREKLDLLLQHLNEESKELFFHSDYDKYDLAEECLTILATKRKFMKACNRPINVSLIDIIWNRKCPLSGIELDYYANRYDRDAPIIDLIDPNNDQYVKGNLYTVAKHKKSRKSMI